jgi:BirA family biotin operon repressor/biotin-[acetyl-CoA-carboxylase] ligase
MGFRLAPGAEAAGYRIKSCDSVGSTNAEAMALGRAGEPGGLWVVSRDQTAGRGRRGRSWAAAPGNLAASLLLKGSWQPAVAATLGFVAGVALRDALAAVAPAASFRLKWPNDLLADGAKLAGILLETETAAQDQRIIVVGIGINVAASPPDVSYPATSLVELTHCVAAEEVFAALSEAWAACARLWSEGRGMAAIRKRWLAGAAGVGEDIAVRLGAEIARGTFETIDDAGQLILRASNGTTRAIAAGDVHFGQAATARELA